MSSKVLAKAAAAMLCLSGAVGVNAVAGADTSPVDFTLPAGDACPDFAMRFVGGGSTANHFKEFTDKGGNVVKTILAGRGQDIEFTNLATNATYNLSANGSNSKTTLNADGTNTVVATGHNVIILFPADITPGPSTTLYVGRVEYQVTDPGGANLFTIVSASGQTIDICAQLA